MKMAPVMWGSMATPKIIFPRDDVVMASACVGVPVGYFDGSAYKTITKTQTITSEYKLFWKGAFAPFIPTNSEPIYSPDINERGLVLSSDGSSLKWLGNGIANETVGTYTKSIVNTVEVWMKDDALKVICCGSETIISSVTWVKSSWTFYQVGKDVAGVGFFSGLIPWHSDCDEVWNGHDLTGQISGPTRAIINNDGTDYGNIGHPSFIDDNMNPVTDSYTYRCKYVSSNSGNIAILGGNL